MFAAALKRFLRDLPNPVIPYEFYDRFIEATRECAANRANGNISCWYIGSWWHKDKGVGGGGREGRREGGGGEGGREREGGGRGGERDGLQACVPVAVVLCNSYFILLLLNDIAYSGNAIMAPHRIYIGHIIDNPLSIPI